jgi:hypothetical protein
MNVTPSRHHLHMTRQRLVLPSVEPPAVLDDSWWMPLILFFSRLKEERSCDLWLPDWDWRQFMVMHGIERRPRPFIVTYKHIETRREVNVDRSGWAYRYRAVGEVGRYDRHKRLRDAFWQLDPIFLRKVREAEVARTGVDEWHEAWEREPDTSQDWLASPDPPAGPYDTWEPERDEPTARRRPRRPKLTVVPAVETGIAD